MADTRTSEVEQQWGRAILHAYGNKCLNTLRAGDADLRF